MEKMVLLKVESIQMQVILVAKNPTNLLENNIELIFIE